MKYYVVDAFAEKVFEGNPAGVCILENWLPEDTMRKMGNTLLQILRRQGDHQRFGGFVFHC